MPKRRFVAVVVVLAMLVVPLGAFAAYPDYDFVDTWGGPGSDPGQFTDPGGIAQGPYGEVFVSEYIGNRIQVFDADGMFLRQLGSAGSGDGQMQHPAGMEVTEDGLLFLADSRNDRISTWSTSGDWYGSFGTSGTGDGQLEAPLDVALGPDGLLYVVENHNHRVQVFEPDGTYVRKWGIFGSATGEFKYPGALEIDSSGTVWVVDSDNDRIQRFTLEGTYLGTVGSSGTGDGELSSPYDIEADPHGNMYVTDSNNSRVQKFTFDGTFVTEFGSSGTGDGEFNFCWGVLPSSERYVMVTDEANHRVQRWFTAVPTAEEPIAGNTRFTTAVAASVAGYPSGLSEDAEGYKTVIIATGRNWPDALGGATLAGVLDAPILLVDTNALPDAVSAEIVRLGATRAIVLGGTVALSGDVANAIDALPGVVDIERIGGDNRYLTAEMIAARAVDLQGLDFDHTAFVATGDNFPDALAGSPIAAANGWPLYLVPASGLLDATKDAMQDAGVVDAHILGGLTTVTAGTESQLNTLLGDANVDRIKGDTRYETAVEIARFGQDAANMNWTYTALATGMDFPDALTGGPIQGRCRSILLLTAGTGDLPSAVGGAIEDHKNAIWTMRYLGGTAAVPQATRDEVANLLY